MLASPLILDLDNRINLNAVGNILASNAGVTGHASNQGRGPWEINMGTVLNAPTAPNEWTNLFLSNAIHPGIGDGNDVGPALAGASYSPSGPFPHPYAQGDYNGTSDPGPAALTAGPYNLPGAANGYFPTYPPAGYGNDAVSEFNNAANQLIHPMFFNLSNPAVGDDHLFALKSHASLMWAWCSALPGSELIQLCPTNFSPTDTGTIGRIHQTTLLSMDIDRACAAPYIFDSTLSAYAVA